MVNDAFVKKKRYEDKIKTMFKHLTKKMAEASLKARLKR